MSANFLIAPPLIVTRDPGIATNITPWMEWFLGCLGRAIDGAQTVLATILNKARFWERVAVIPINDRQRLVLNRLLDGFEGKLTTSKYAKLAKCSQDTALRDILSLVERSVFVRNPGGGRSTSYLIAPAFVSDTAEANAGLSAPSPCLHSRAVMH